jgi:hypothetical protein
MLRREFSKNEYFFMNIEDTGVADEAEFYSGIKPSVNSEDIW